MFWLKKIESKYDDSNSYLSSQFLYDFTKLCKHHITFPPPKVTVKVLRYSGSQACTFPLASKGYSSSNNLLETVDEAFSSSWSSLLITCIGHCKSSHFFLTTLTSFSSNKVFRVWVGPGMDLGVGGLTGVDVGG